MVSVFEHRDNNTAVNQGELLSETRMYFKIHTRTKRYYKKKYHYKNQFTLDFKKDD